MTRKLCFAAVSLFWIAMMVFLVRKEAGTSTEDRFYREFFEGGIFGEETVMEIYWQGKKVGESKTSYTLSSDGVTIHNRLSLSFGDMAVENAKISIMTRIDKEFRLRRLLANAEYGGQEISVVGIPDGDNLSVKITGWGPERNFVVPSPDPRAFASGPFPALTVKNRRPGDEWDVPLFDFASMNIVQGRARVESREKHLWGGKERNCRRVVVRDTLGRQMLTAWADMEGRLLEIDFAGIKLIRKDL